MKAHALLAAAWVLASCLMFGGIRSLSAQAEEQGAVAASASGPFSRGRAR